MLDPEIEGSNVYLPLIIDSPWGLETLAHSDSITMKVNGITLTGDPIETAVGNAVRITWTWDGAKGGIENISVEVIFNLQTTGPTLSGSSTFEIETLTPEEVLEVIILLMSHFVQMGMEVHFISLQVSN